MKNEPQKQKVILTDSRFTNDPSSNDSLSPHNHHPITNNYSKGQRRVSLAAGLLIIPEDIQEKLRMMTSSRSSKHRRLKRSLSGRSYSHHSLLPTPGSLAQDYDDDEDDDYRKSTRRKSEGPNITLNVGNNNISSNLAMSPITTENVSSPAEPSADVTNDSTMIYNNLNNNNKKSARNHHQRRLHGRMRRSSSLDHNMIRQITAGPLASRWAQAWRATGTLLPSRAAPRANSPAGWVGHGVDMPGDGGGG
jgi:hypothetical protein